MNAALIVALCYKGKDSYIKGEGTLKDIEIIKSILIEKFGFDTSDIKVLKEEMATVKNFKLELERMITENKKHNFVYFVGHGSTVKNNDQNKSTDNEANDSVLCFWDGYIYDDDMCKIISGFDSKTKNLFMFAQCHSGGSADLKFNLKIDGNLEKFKKVRDVGSKSVLISAVDSEQISWVWPNGTNLAKCFKKVVDDTNDLTFLDLMQKMRELCPKQNLSISSSFKLDKHDKLFEPKHYSWKKL